MFAASALTMLLVACGTAGSELTTEQLLGKLAGHSLTQSEINEQLEVADLLCGFDGRVLVQIWDRLNARQLEFQDYVFGQHCPDRLSIYESARPSTGTAPATTATTSTTIDTTVFDNIEPAITDEPASTPGGTGRTSTTATPNTASTTTTRVSSTGSTTATTTAG